MKKFKKGLALSLALAMGLSLVACGGKEEATTTAAPAADDTTAAAADDAETTAAAEEAATMEAPGTDGEKIYVYSWNSELGDIIDKEFKTKYPEYADLIENVNLGVGGTSDEYKTAVENAITGAGDQYPSIIAMDTDMAKHFMESSYTANLYDLGITDAMYAEAYQYTKDHAMIDGQLKGLSWQATPGCFCYRADIAAEVLGSDDPAKVQEAVKDWDAFFATADQMKAAGYSMLSGPDDVKYLYINNKQGAWVADGKLNIDASVNEYLETNKKLYDGGYTNKSSMWDDAWSSGFDGKVFGYFGCTWFVYWSIKSVDHKGDWRICAGPVDYFWGGSYLAVGKDTPNPELAAFIAYTLCCDTDFMYEHMKSTFDYVNNKAAVQKCIDNGEGASDMLGGQNPVEIWAAQADKIVNAYATSYDMTFNGYMDAAALAYSSGEAATVEDAIEIIKNKVAESYGDVITVE